MLKNYLNLKDVLGVMAKAERHFADDDPRFQDGEKCWMLGQFIIMRLLGEDWFKRNATREAKHTFLYGGSAQLEREINGLKLGAPNSDESQMGFVDALVEVCEMRNFAYFLEEIKRQEFTAAHAELLVAQLLVNHGYKPSARIRSYSKKSDYEFDIILPDGFGAVEVKHKDREKEFSANGIRNTFDEARSQLPDDRPNFLFVHIPSKWCLDNEFWKMTEVAIPKFFNSSRRINEIIFFAIVRGDNNKMIQKSLNTCGYVFKHPNPRQPTSATMERQLIAIVKALSFWPYEKLLKKVK